MVYLLVGMEAGKALGTQPVISAKEMIDPEVDHLGIMAYVALFQHIKPQVKTQPPSRASPVTQPAPVRVQPPSTPVMSSPRVPPGEMLQLITPSRQSHVNSPVRGTLVASGDCVIEKVTIVWFLPLKVLPVGMRA